MKGNAHGNKLNPSGQDSMPLPAYANTEIRTSGAVDEFTGVKSLIARCFTPFEDRGNARLNPCVLLAAAEADSCPPSVISVTAKPLHPGADYSFRPADDFCKTGVRPGTEGRFGKLLSEAAPNDHPVSGRFLLRAKLSTQAKAAKPGKHFVFAHHGLPSTRNLSRHSKYTTRAVADTRRGERRNEE